MNTIKEVKKLISEGETQEAIDALQALLEGKNESLLNQVYSLESQFKDVQKKMRVGIMQESSELNRINMAILSICDDAKVANLKASQKVTQKDNDASSPAALFQNPAVKYGAIGAAALILIFFLVRILNRKEDGAMDNSLVQQSQMNTQPTTVDENNGNVDWHATPNTITVKEEGYNDIQIEVQQISSVDKSDDNKTITVKVHQKCIDASRSGCFENDLKYFIKYQSSKIELIDETTTVTRFEIDEERVHDLYFELPKDVHEAEFDIYYVNKLKETIKLTF